MNQPQASNATPQDKLPNVAQPHTDYMAMLPTWNEVRDCVAGEKAVKTKGELYLPKPAMNDGEESTKVKERYNDYKKRAVFFNATGRTLRGMVGEVFGRDSTHEVPKPIEDLLPNVDGFGRSAEQLAKEALSYALQFGRGGFLADYPNRVTPDGTPQVTTVAELRNSNIRPRVLLYPPDAIVNWRLSSYGALSLLSLVVIKEDNLLADDGFEEIFNEQYRVLRLTPDRKYTVEIWRQPNKGASFQLAEGPYTPTDASGKPFDLIPFTFFGPDDNGAYPNLPPMADIAAMNLAHYRNSADYEDSCNLVGQPTLFLFGVTSEWVKTVMKGKIRFGARSVVPLEQGAKAELIQAQENTMAKEAMEHKERQMVALGAQLVEQKAVQQTATEAGHNNKAKMSTLASSAKNVGEAITMALKWASAFIGADNKDISYELNTDFDISRMTPQEQAQVIASWQAEAIDYEEMRFQFKRGGVAWKDDLEVQDTNATAREDWLGVKTVGGRLGPDPGVDLATGLPLGVDPKTGLPKQQPKPAPAK